MTDTFGNKEGKEMIPETHQKDLHSEHFVDSSPIDENEIHNSSVILNLHQDITMYHTGL